MLDYHQNTFTFPFLYLPCCGLFTFNQLFWYM